MPVQRRLRALLLLTWALAPTSVRADDPPAAPAYQQLRYEEDYRYLRDPSRRSDFLDRLKYIALTQGDESYLTLGGEARERYEYFHNSQWGAGPQDDSGYALQRYMVHADVHLGEHVRFFSQLKSGLEDGRHGGPRPSDEDRLDVNQAFVDVTVAFEPTTLTARLGRQELQYGTSRIISAREGPNVRQSFDGIKLIAKTGDARVDLFLARPVETNRGFFDDKWDSDRTFWGVYFTRALWAGLDAHIDLYYLGLDRSGAEFDQGTGHELRHSLGVRLFGKPKPWDYNFEALWQFGTFKDADIEAWTAASDTGYTLPLALQTRLALKADIASGDRNPNAGTLQTFNALFPRGAYFSETALIGPANFIDVHPSIEVRPGAGVLVFADWDFFWRQSLNDGLYGVAVNLVRSGQNTNARYIGDQAQIGVEWTFLRHFTLVALYAHFFAGPFIEDTGPGKDVDYASTWLTFKF